MSDSIKALLRSNCLSVLTLGGEQELTDHLGLISDRQSRSQSHLMPSLSCFLNSLLTVVAQLLNAESITIGRLFPLSLKHFNPDTIEFLKSIGQRSNIVGLHIPLDYSLNNAIRNKFRSKLDRPEHLVFMEIASALNLLAFAGLRVVDYEYTFNFLHPSGHRSILSKKILPLRYLVAKISPWLLSITFGGASVMVLAVTPNGLKEYSTNE